MFKFKDYQKEIPENTPVGNTILKIEADDEDTPEKTQVIDCENKAVSLERW